ncbi:MAG: S8 family serine peptidase [Clostridiales bacterium]|nr:S8 family serine peptidase [Clostridiales bacterium]
MKSYFLFFISFMSLALSILFVSVVFAEEAYDNQFLFKLKDDLDEVFLTEYRNFGVDVVSENLSIYKADYDTIENLRELGLIDYAEENALIELADLETGESVPISGEEPKYNDAYFKKQWYFEKHNLLGAKERLGNGKGVRIAVIDSGVAVQEDFNSSNIEEGYNYINPDKTGNYISDNDTLTVRVHGTQVAGIICSKSDNEIGIAGIAEEATIVPLIVYQDGTNSLENVIRAIDDAVRKYNCDIINMSLTTPTKSKFLQEAVDYANKNNVIVIAAAGNGGAASYLYPASCENVISVGSVDLDFGVSYFSQKNDYVDISAAGSGLTLVGCDGVYRDGRQGTSFSAPIISGFAALIKEKYPYVNGELFLKILKAGSYDIENVGYDIYTGFGAFNAFESMEFIEKNRDFFISPIYINGSDIRVKIFGDGIFGNLIFAVYDENGKMKDFYTQTFETENQVFCKGFKQSLEKGEVIKVFAFDNFLSMKPLGEARISVGG